MISVCKPKVNTSCTQSHGKLGFHRDGSAYWYPSVGLTASLQRMNYRVKRNLLLLKGYCFTTFVIRKTV
jgi:hypothetical protein